MKKNKLFIILIITIAALVFTTAQICNQCGITPDQQTEEDISDETGTDDTGATTTERDASAATTATTITGDPEEPTIELQVYMGPEYNAADDVCFYRVEAVVTGNPMPTEADFSKDDSNTAWGPLRAQVNLTRAEPDYTLTASVTTSAGTAEDSIDLSWGCDGEVDDGEEVVEEVAEEGNNCPVISDFTRIGFHMETYPCNLLNTYICDASDPDGDELTYNWDLSAGTIEEIENNVVVEGVERESAMSFYTPDTSGTITITVVVSDGICEVPEVDTMEVVCE